MNPSKLAYLKNPPGEVANRGVVVVPQAARGRADSPGGLAEKERGRGRLPGGKTVAIAARRQFRVTAAEHAGRGI